MYQTSRKTHSLSLSLSMAQILGHGMGQTQVGWEFEQTELTRKTQDGPNAGGLDI